MSYWILNEHTYEEIAQEASKRGVGMIYITMDTPKSDRIFWSLEDAIAYIEESMPEWIAEGIEYPASIGLGECKVTGDEAEPIRPTERYWTWDGNAVSPY